MKVPMRSQPLCIVYGSAATTTGRVDDGPAQQLVGDLPHRQQKRDDCCPLQLRASGLCLLRLRSGGWDPECREWKETSRYKYTFKNTCYRWSPLTWLTSFGVSACSILCASSSACAAICSGLFPARTAASTVSASACATSASACGPPPDLATWWLGFKDRKWQTRSQ
jgi:hypothetical protein